MDTEDETGEAKDGQRVVYEGPILISTTEVKGEFVMSQLRDKILGAIAKGHLTNEESTRHASLGFIYSYKLFLLSLPCDVRCPENSKSIEVALFRQVPSDMPYFSPW